VPTIKTAVDIAASPEMVWRVLTYFPDYPKWNPFVVSIHGSLAPGQRLKIQARRPQGREYRFSPLVVKVIPASELRWRRWRLIEGVFDRELAFLIVPNGIKGVRFIQREHFSGFLAPLIMRFISEKTLKGFNLMNLALKRAAETKR
jgi:hypothetical protein